MVIQVDAARELYSAPVTKRHGTWVCWLFFSSCVWPRSLVYLAWKQCVFSNLEVVLKIAEEEGKRLSELYESCTVA